MFKFEDHMPSYWLNESRDFQLMCRLDDTLFMGQRNDIATIQNLNTSNKCKNTFLNLLAKKVGFFTNKQIEDNVLRNIISAFRLAIKYKGTKQGILYAVTAILKAENSTGTPRIDINVRGDYEIDIYTPTNIINKEALNEFLKYIVPTGYHTNIYSYSYNIPLNTDTFNSRNRIAWVTPNITSVGTIKNNKDKIVVSNNDRVPNKDIENPIYTYMEKTYFGAANSGMIVSLDDLNNKNATNTNGKEKESNFDKDSGIEIIK